MMDGDSWMISYKSRFLERAEVWFDNEITENAKPIDWILYHQRSQPVAGAKSRRFYTRLIDLSQTEEQLRAALSEDTAYKIRRARGHDKIICECCDARDTAVMNRFEEVYRLFAAKKDLPDRKSTRLNSSHLVISYAVFCLKKKKVHVNRRSYTIQFNTA